MWTVRRLAWAVIGLTVWGGLVVLMANQHAPAWSDGELATLRSLSLASLGPLPPDPSNAVADDPLAAALGQQLFFDSLFSADGQVACATCHRPSLRFTDGRALAQGVGVATRNTMALAGSAYSPWQTWDGKADSQWSQALLPLESPVEQGGDRTFYAHLLAEYYGPEYTALFGPLPDLSDPRRFPLHAGPVADPAARAAWDAMAPADQDAINRVYANLGKALAAYDRTLRPQAAPFDAYVAAVERGDRSAQSQALSAAAIAGLRLFIGRAHCINCHNDPLFTNFDFHNTGVPPAPGLPLDHGRRDGIRQLQESIFNCLGKYSDAQPEQCTQLRFLKSDGPTLDGGFRTPSLRGVAETAPYMHAGQFADLHAVLDHYNSGGLALMGHDELTPLGLTDRELGELEAFLRALSAPAPADAEPAKD